MIWFFIAGFISGVVGTLWFGRWYTQKQLYDAIERTLEEEDDERTGEDP